MYEFCCVGKDNQNQFNRKLYLRRKEEQIVHQVQSNAFTWMSFLRCIIQEGTIVCNHSSTSRRVNPLSYLSPGGQGVVHSSTVQFGLNDTTPLSMILSVGPAHTVDIDSDTASH